jgi:hypothetical protein
MAKKPASKVGKTVSKSAAGGVKGGVAKKKA